MFAVTVPVASVIDEIFLDEDQIEVVCRVQLLHINNFWLVLWEDFYDGQGSQSLKCFTRRDDAMRYLKLLGYDSGGA